MNQDYSPQNMFNDTRSWAERNGFADWALAFLWLIAAFFLFQVAAGVVAGILLVAKHGASMGSMSNPMDAFSQSLDLVFIGNSAGQILFLGLGTWFFTRLHTSVKAGRKPFLRLRVNSDTFAMIGISAVLILAVQPSIWLLSWINVQLPIPDFFENLQASQVELIEQFLRGDHLLLLTLFHVGIVPAVCEEILYRGYVMRSFERSWGIWPAIIISGILFGLYHVQLTNLLPLSAIGILLAYLTWVSRSLYPAMVAHLINNGGSVLVGTYYPESAFAELTPETMPPVWTVILSLVVSGYLIYLMYNQFKTDTGETDV